MAFIAIASSLLLSGVSAVLIDVFADNACSAATFVRNTSTNFQVFQGACAPANFIFPQIVAPATVQLNVGLDVCAPGAVTVAIFGPSPQNPDGFNAEGFPALSWSDPDSCNLPRLTTVALTAGACVPVIVTIPGGPLGRNYRNLLVEYWRLNTATCAPPTPPPAAGTTPPLLSLRTRPFASGNVCPPPAGPALGVVDFADREVLPGACASNITSFSGLGPGRDVFQGDVSYFLRPGGAPNQWNVDVFNNNAMPGFPLGIAGCGTNESPHWLGTIPNMPVTPAVGADCLTTVLTPPPAMGLAAPITITARLFAQRTFTTSNTAPAAGAAAAPALEQAGLIVGGVGVGVAAAACLALCGAYIMLRRMAARIEELGMVGAPRAVPEWGATSAPKALELTAIPVLPGAVPVGNPLNVQAQG